jgi:hypothetical protein
MKASRQQTLPPMELKPVKTGLDRRSEQRSTEVQTFVHTERDWRGLVETARVKAGYSHKAMAADLGITAPLLTAQLAGEPKNHLSLWRMRGLSREFWQEFVVLIVRFYDLTIASDPQTVAYAEIGRRVVEVLALSDATRRRA